MISRRSFIGTVAFGIFFLPLTAAAQPASKRVVRIGYLGVTPRPTDESFRQGLRELGYVEGQNIAIEYRWGGGSASDHDALARELVCLKVDVIVAIASPSTRAAKQATGTIPVVMVDVGDPVAFGFVPSLARPGGNVTGLSAALTESYPKGLQLLKEVIPNLARAGSFDEPTHPAVAAGWNRVIDRAVQTLGVTLQRYNVLEPADLKRAFAAMSSDRPDALLVLPSHFLYSQREQILDFAARTRLPAFYGLREYVPLGGLMSLTPDRDEMFKRAAAYVSKILKGAKPADLPVEQPTHWELVINLKTAKTLGLTIPQSVLVRADQIIE